MFPLFNVNKLEVMNIQNNSDFYNYATRGNGSEQNPFVLEDLKLGSSKRKLKEMYKLVRVTNTSSSFIIQNCDFTGGAFCIYILDDVSGQILITNNTFTGIYHYFGFDASWPTQAAIWIHNISSNITISNNKLTGRMLWGMYLTDIGNVCIENNDYDFSHFPSNTLEIFSSHEITILNNTFNGDIDINDADTASFISNKFIYNSDLRFERISKSIFLNNSFKGNSVYSSIVFNRMNNFIFSGNNITNGWRGLQLNQCNDSIINANSFYNCLHYALILDSDTNNTTVYHNSFIQNNLESNSQAFDNGNNNRWFSLSLLEGNYWDNLGINITYEIDGSAESEDLYPLPPPV